MWEHEWLIEKADWLLVTANRVKWNIIQKTRQDDRKNWRDIDECFNFEWNSIDHLRNNAPQRIEHKLYYKYCSYTGKTKHLSTYNHEKSLNASVLGLIQSGTPGQPYIRSDFSVVGDMAILSYHYFIHPNEFNNKFIQMVMNSLFPHLSDYKTTV